MKTKVVDHLRAKNASGKAVRKIKNPGKPKSKRDAYGEIGRKILKTPGSRTGRKGGVADFQGDYDSWGENNRRKGIKTKKSKAKQKRRTRKQK